MERFETVVANRILRMHRPALNWQNFLWYDLILSAAIITRGEGLPDQGAAGRARRARNASAARESAAATAANHWTAGSRPTTVVRKPTLTTGRLTRTEHQALAGGVAPARSSAQHARTAITWPPRTRCSPVARGQRSQFNWDWPVQACIFGPTRCF
jgi:hypothetical protein